MDESILLVDSVFVLMSAVECDYFIMGEKKLKKIY